MKTRVCALLVATLTALALQSPPPAAAAQKWSRLQLSMDGRHWSEDPQASLFDRRLVLAPGTSEQRTFFVRNQSGEAARLRVAVVVHDPTGGLAHDGFRMALRVRGGHSIPVRGHGARPASEILLAKGEVVPVSVRVELLPGAGRTFMNRHLTFTVRVRLSQRMTKGKGS